MPYRIHPDNLMNSGYAHIGEARRSSRQWMLFFAGNTDPKKYDKVDVSEGHGVLTRHVLIETIKGYYGDEKTYLVDPNNTADIIQDGYATIDFSRNPIDNSRWLATLAKAHFFVAAPGVHMPMSHNVIEAMAVGTIPLLEYADYFDPPLEHRVNCITFSGETGLKAALKEIKELNADEIEQMREAVIQYFKEFLSPEAAIQRIVNHPKKRFRLLWNAHKTNVRPAS